MFEYASSDSIEVSSDSRAAFKVSSTRCRSNYTFDSPTGDVRIEKKLMDGLVTAW
jgi:hypothetical protein